MTASGMVTSISGRSKRSAQRVFMSVGWSVRRGLPSVCFHCPPPAARSFFQPDALNEAPPSEGSVYVWIRWKPIALHALAAAE